MSAALAFRRAAPTDRRFVVQTFLDSFRAERSAGLIQMSDWQGVMAEQAEKLFSRPGSEVVVAYKPAEEPPFDAYGWIAVERGHLWPVVVYCFVKENYRRQGLARMLFAEARIDPMSRFRHASWIPRELVDKVPRAVWNPLTVRFPLDLERERAMDEQRTRRREHEQGRAAGRP